MLWSMKKAGKAQMRSRNQYVRSHCLVQEATVHVEVVQLPM